MQDHAQCWLEGEALARTVEKAERFLVARPKATFEFDALRAFICDEIVPTFRNGAVQAGAEWSSASGAYAPGIFHDMSQVVDGIFRRAGRRASEPNVMFTLSLLLRLQEFCERPRSLDEARREYCAFKQEYLDSFIAEGTPVKQAKRNLHSRMEAFRRMMTNAGRRSRRLETMSAQIKEITREREQRGSQSS